MKKFMISLMMTSMGTLPVIGQVNTAQELKSMAILSMDSELESLVPQKAGDLLRIEAEKLGKYEIMDKYDVRYLVEQNNINMDNCFGKICLVGAGEALKVESMLTGSIEEYSDGIAISLRFIDVKKKQIVKTVTREYGKDEKYIQLMIEVTLKDLFGLENNVAIVEAIQKKRVVPEVEDPAEEIPMLRSDGPRMGLTMLTGEAAQIFKADKSVGGFDSAPVMFQFGYQFEAKYLSTGNFQALFEFLPMITGLDQGLFIPSLTVMNGLRFNKQGFEFAFGPTVSFGKKARGYYDGDGNWQLQSHWNETVEDPYTNPNPFEIESRMDSRGNPALIPGFIFAAGYTIRSGNLNMPINAFVIPNTSGLRFGVSVGFNATKVKKQK